MFQFKQFGVDQSSCAMKINTDGVLLGALAIHNDPVSVLDIGTGTGVIALMLAQRYQNAKIDAVEIDESAGQTAIRNFAASPFADRLVEYSLSFENYFDQFPERKYDLIVSNPPFYVNSLKSPSLKKALAKHANSDFFKQLLNCVSNHLKLSGCFWLILPVPLSELVIDIAAPTLIYPQQVIQIKSFEQSEAHRVIICFGFDKVSVKTSKLTIYKAVGIYSDDYKALLKPYFLAF